MVRRNKILRTQMDIYRTAVVDPSICDVVQFTPREISIIGKAQGATHVTFWFEGGDRLPMTYLIQVVPDVTEVKIRTGEYRLLEEVLAELFPDSKVYLDIIANKLIVRGQAKDAEEAARILAIIGSEAGNRNAFRQRGGRLNDGEAASVLSDHATGRRGRSGLQIINMLRVPGIQQVALRVKIAEISRSAGRGLDTSLRAQIDFKEGDHGHSVLPRYDVGCSQRQRTGAARITRRGRHFPWPQLPGRTWCATTTLRTNRGNDEWPTRDVPFWW